MSHMCGKDKHVCTKSFLVNRHVNIFAMRDSLQTTHFDDGVHSLVVLCACQSGSRDTIASIGIAYTYNMRRNIVPIVPYDHLYKYSLKRELTKVKLIEIKGEKYWEFPCNVGIVGTECISFKTRTHTITKQKRTMEERITIEAALKMMQAEKLRLESRHALDQAAINDLITVCCNCYNEDCWCEPPDDDARDGIDTVE